ncbi:MAG: CopG family transcriptional regulator [Gammaproteobacteria bacterium]|nr:CopG family transcriptional regulator [Gammaproteobacteria bacterium]
MRHPTAPQPPGSRPGQSTHRSESDLANEALELYLEREQWTVEKIKTGLAQAERGDFVPDEEMEAFFAQRMDSDAQ